MREKKRKVVEVDYRENLWKDAYWVSVLLILVFYWLLLSVSIYWLTYFTFQRLTNDQEASLLKSVGKGRKRDSQFAKKAFDLVYDTEELAARSAAGRPAPSSRSPPRPACTPDKKYYFLCKFPSQLRIAIITINVFSFPCLLFIDLLNRRVTDEAEKFNKSADKLVSQRANLKCIEDFLTSKICTVRRTLFQAPKSTEQVEDSPESDDSSEWSLNTFTLM